MKLRMLQLAVWDYSIRMHLMPLVRACRDHGYEVVCAAAPGPFVPEIEAEGFRYLPIPFSRSLDVRSHGRALHALTRALGAEKFDIVHAHTFLAGLLGRVSARLSAVPLCVYTAHGFRFHERMSPFPYYMHLACEAFAARFTDFLFVQNDEDRRTALRYGLLDQARILTIGSGIDLERFSRGRVTPQALTALRRELDLPPQARIVTTIARPTLEKGVREFVEMSDRLSAVRSDTYFVAVLPEFPGERHSVAAEILSRPRCRLRCVGFRRDIPELLALSEVFVLPTHFEGYSRVVMEAMAMGVPVVASDVRGCRGLVLDARTGILVEPRSVDAFVDAVGMLLTDDALRARLGRNARSVAERAFDASRSIDLQLSVLDALTRRQTMGNDGCRIQTS